MEIIGVFTEEQCKKIKENYYNKTLYNFLSEDYILIDLEINRIVKHESISLNTDKFKVIMKFELYKGRLNGK